MCQGGVGRREAGFLEELTGPCLEWQEGCSQAKTWDSENSMCKGPEVAVA